jgi:hypothetical protein
MSKFFTRYAAKVVENKRPDGFPREIYVDETYEDIQSQEQLQDIVNKRFRAMVMSAGLVVMKDHDGTIDASIITFDKRMFVPWHMLCNFHIDMIKQIVEPSPVPQDALVPEPLPAPTTPETVH